MVLPSKKMRFRDLDDNLLKNNKDFSIRKTGITSAQVIVFMTITMIVIYGISTIFDSQNREIFAAMSSVVGIVLLVAAINVESNKKKLQKVEFLNAVFASLLGNKYIFSFLVKQDDLRIVYFDSHSQRTFPEIVYSEHNIDSLLLKHKISDVDVASIKQQIQNAKTASQDIKINFPDENGEPKNCVLSIEAVARPSGFSLLRGKLEII